jgi:peroxiredoxin family protein
MSAEAPETPSGRPAKLSLVVHSGDFDKVHYALVLAAAAAVGTPAMLFFTMGACRALVAGGDAWRAMPSGLGGDGGGRDDGFAERRLATFEELLSACAEMGVRFMVCEMGLKAMDLTRASLRDDITIEEGGVVTFLNDAAADGAMMFI